MDEPFRLSKKAMARQSRDAKKGQRDEQRKARLAVSPITSNVPRVGTAAPDSSLTPRASEDPDGYLNEVMKYVRNTGDCEGRWSWGQHRKLLEDEWHDHIEPQLRQHASETWGHICQLVVRGARRVLMRHHHQDVAEIHKEAQERWLELKLKQHHTAFRFRMGSRRRLWGFRVGAVFHVVWWDTEHKIYPTKPVR